MGSMAAPGAAPILNLTPMGHGGPLTHDFNGAGIEGIMGGGRPAKVMFDYLQDVSQDLLQHVEK